MHLALDNDFTQLRLRRQHLAWFLVFTRLVRTRGCTISFVLYPFITILLTRLLKMRSIPCFLPAEYRMSGMLAAPLHFSITLTIAKSSSITCSLLGFLFLFAAYWPMQLPSWIITPVAGIINAILQQLIASYFIHMKKSFAFLTSSYSSVFSDIVSLSGVQLKYLPVQIKTK